MVFSPTFIWHPHLSCHSAQILPHGALWVRLDECYFSGLRLVIIFTTACLCYLFFMVGTDGVDMTAEATFRF